MEKKTHKEDSDNDFAVDDELPLKPTGEVRRNPWQLGLPKDANKPIKTSGPGEIAPAVTKGANKRTSTGRVATSEKMNKDSEDEGDEDCESRKKHVKAKNKGKYVSIKLYYGGVEEEEEEDFEEEVEEEEDGKEEDEEEAVMPKGFRVGDFIALKIDCINPKNPPKEIFRIDSKRSLQIYRSYDGEDDTTFYKSTLVFNPWSVDHMGSYYRMTVTHPEKRNKTQTVTHPEKRNTRKIHVVGFRTDDLCLKDLSDSEYE